MDEYEILNTHLVSHYNPREEQARDMKKARYIELLQPLLHQTPKREKEKQRLYSDSSWISSSSSSSL
jgi:hypothetical protein